MLHTTSLNTVFLICYTNCTNKNKHKSSEKECNIYETFFATNLLF